MATQRSRAFVVLLLVLLSATGRSAAQIQPTATIKFGGMLGFRYQPTPVLIRVGGTIIWQGNTGDGFGGHPLVSDENLWPTVSSATSFIFTFTAPGIYRYHCLFHGAAGGVGMAGEVQVYTSVFLPLTMK